MAAGWQAKQLRLQSIDRRLIIWEKIDMPASLSTKSKYQATHLDRQINHRNRQKLFANAERYST